MEQTLNGIASVQIVSEGLEDSMTSGAQRGDVSGTTAQTSGSALTTAVTEAGTQVGDVDGDGDDDPTTSSATSGGTNGPTGPGNIISVSIANSKMGIGDKVIATITAAQYGLSLSTDSTIAGFTLGDLVDNQDGTYTASFTVTAEGEDIAAEEDIPVYVVMLDASENKTTAYTQPISQNLDAIDINPPTVSLRYSTDTNSVDLPSKTSLAVKNADTLRIFASFSEAIDSESGATISLNNGDNDWVISQSLTRVSDTLYYYDLDVPTGDFTATVSLEAQDQAGNALDSAPSNATFTVDNTAPTANLTAVTDDVGTITGTLSSGDSTDDTSLVLSGSNDAGSTVTVYNGDKVLGQAIVTDTSWSYTATIVDGQSYQFAVKETDLAGNESQASDSFTVIGDTTAPTQSISNIAISDDTGFSDSDFITKTASQTVTATLSAGLNQGEVLSFSVDGGTNWSDVSSSISNETEISLSDVTLSGTSALQFRVSDKAGNTGSTASQDYVLDTVAPTTGLTAIAMSNDTGSSDSDFIVNTSQQTITATLDAPLADDEKLFLAHAAGKNPIEVTDINGTAVTVENYTLPGSMSSLGFEVTDTAGNKKTTSTGFYLVDVNAPTVTISDASYDTQTNTLTLTGSKMDTIVTGGIDKISDYTANLDWSKLQWDIDNDDTDNITFAASDIESTTSEGETILTITLGDAKAAELEGSTGFDPLSENDKLEITAGFIRDTAGNVTTTDAFDGPAYSKSIVVFDLVEGQSSDHSERQFQTDIDYTIYIRVDSDRLIPNTTPTNNAGGTWGKWTNADNLGSGDKIIVTGDGSAILGFKNQPIDVGATVQQESRLKFKSSLDATVLDIRDSGLGFRYYNNDYYNFRMWSNGDVSNFTLFSVSVLTQIPSNVMMSQGLVV